MRDCQGWPRACTGSSSPPSCFLPPRCHKLWRKEASGTISQGTPAPMSLPSIPFVVAAPPPGQGMPWNLVLEPQSRVPPNPVCPSLTPALSPCLCGPLLQKEEGVTFYTCMGLLSKSAESSDPQPKLCSREKQIIPHPRAHCPLGIHGAAFWH